MVIRNHNRSQTEVQSINSINVVHQHSRATGTYTSMYDFTVHAAAVAVVADAACTAISQRKTPTSCTIASCHWHQQEWWLLLGSIMVVPLYAGKCALGVPGCSQPGLHHLLHTWRAKKVRMPSSPRSDSPNSLSLEMMTGSVSTTPASPTMPPCRSHRRYWPLVWW